MGFYHGRVCLLSYSCVTLIWAPLVVFLFFFFFSQGHSGQGVGLLIYSLSNKSGNVDYLARITLMKKMGDVHPLITVLV